MTAINNGTLPNSANYKSGRSDSIKYIVIHFTSNNGDTALGNVNYFANNKVSASAHYFVDENSIYTSVPESDTAWHCGASTYYDDYCRNSNSLGVEMCSRKNDSGNYYIKDEVIQNAIDLTKQLMAKYSIPVENVLRHYDITHKSCPEPFVRTQSLWDDFKNRLTEEEIDMEELNALKEKVIALETEVESLKNKNIYNWVDDNMPSWARDTVTKLCDKGVLKGNENGELGLTDELLRILVMNDRAGVYDVK